MIDRDHPAVEALARELAFLDDGDPWPSNEELGGSPTGTRDDEFRAAQEETAVEHIGVVLPHLESATEDNLARLRNTPAGRALMAEGWDRGVADNERGWDHVYSGHDVDPDDPLAVCQTCETPNPYRTETPQ